jgi:hypothetical protein
MAVGTTVAILAAAAIGAGSAAYQTDVQKQLSDQDRSRRKTEADRQQAEADRIARETRPDEEGLAETKFGTDKADEDAGSTSDFLVPKSSALGGGSGRSGLGFTV